jgi:SM-20-related protein
MEVGAEAGESEPIAAIARELAEAGYSVRRDFMPRELAEALVAEHRRIEEAGLLVPAGIGTGARFQVRDQIRGDRLCWMDPEALSAVQRRFCEALEALRTALNRRLFLGLWDFEGFFALYPPGSFYRRHSDVLQGRPARVVSCTLYLNQAWRQEDGGHLRLYVGEPERPVDILPQLGSFAAFLSQEIEHEVLPSARARRSVTGWLRRRP